MARRTVGTHKGVEEKRRSLPIYQHYTLSPGKTKSHHPEARCNHCEKEFVCGSKQRLIRHLRKCNSISNPEQIIAETLNTLARNSATGQLNHSILEASNLLPSQIPHHLHHNPVAPQHQLVAGHQQQPQIHSTSSPITTANSNISNNNNLSNHNTSGSSSNDTGLIASSSNGAQPSSLVNPTKRTQRRGRKPANQSANAPSIHVTTGLDGKTHFTPASQLPQTISGTVNTPLIAQMHNGRPVGYTSYTTASPTATTGAHISANSGHLACATHNHTSPYKLNTESIDKAYLKLVLTRNLPLSLCDTKEFQLWVKTFANDYKPPSSINLIGHNLKHEAQVAKQRISNILVKAPKKTINLELHSWSDQVRGHLWYAILANIEHKRFLISLRDINVQQQPRVDTNDQINETTSDRVLANFIDECIKRIGSDRINSLIFPGKYEADAFSARARQSLYSTHPSIVTYDCWAHFTNLLCSDIVEYNKVFSDLMRNSNRLIDFVHKRPKVGLGLEKFGPFSGVTGPVNQSNNRRWYSHLVCYLLEYIKNNNEAITKALEAYTTSSTQSHLSSDNNNNSASGTGNNQSAGIHQSSTTLSTQNILCHEEIQLIEIKSMIASSEFWSNLNLALHYLKPIRDIVALNPNVSSSSSNNNNNNSTETSVATSTPSIHPASANALLISDYMRWFLDYGKTLFDSWNQSPDSFKCHLIERYLIRFSSSISEFKLLFAAYLLNPKHRCAYMTQKAKDTAIEEILNIASEFMPEESDGHTIFDQWKLYLVREEPYDMVYEENRSTPLEWWMSLPCAESIRRVALRILRLKAFASAKPETIFSQLYFYEDETKNSVNNTTFEDVSVLRYFYDYEDKTGLHNQLGAVYNYSNMNNPSSNSFSSDGYQDKTHLGQPNNHHSQQANYSSEYLSADNLGVGATTNGQENDSLNGVRQCFPSDSFSDVVVDSYTNQNLHSKMNSKSNVDAVSAIEDLPGYGLFLQYVDYNDSGVQIVVEEPVEKKRRKWTAQEILSKCQSNHQNSSNNNDINCKL